MQYRIQEALVWASKANGGALHNRQLENVLQQIFIRLQLILSEGKVKVKESKVARAAKGLKEYRGTIIPKEFIKARMHSWLVQLHRISHFLSKREGV